MLAEPEVFEYEMRIMDKKLGDRVIKWRPGDTESRKKAKKIFDEHIKNGGLAYRYRDKLSDGEVIHEFDPEADRIAMMPKMVLSPPMAGG